MEREQGIKQIRGKIQNQHIKLGQLYREIGEYDLSIEEFKKAIRFCPDTPFFKNKILNEVEISQGKIVLESFPRQIQVTLTNRCNLRCIMCDSWQTPWDIPEKTVKEIIELLPYLQYIDWFGGEPFCSKYFEELFDKASTYPHLSQRICTNGLFINEKWAKKLIQKNVILNYSIDGVTKKTYEYIRKGAKFEDIIRSINFINEYRERYTHHFGFGLHFVVMKSNYDELEQIVDFAKEYKFDNLQIRPVEKALHENIFFSKDLRALNYIKKVKPIIFKKAKKYKIKLFYQIPQFEVFPPHEMEFNGEQKLNPGKDFQPICGGSGLPRKILCYAPWQSLFIGPKGNVKPLWDCIKSIRNVEQNSLKEIWNDKVMQIYRKKLLNNCPDWCSYRCGFCVPEEVLKLS